MCRTIVCALFAMTPLTTAGCGLIGSDSPVSEKPEKSPRKERVFQVVENSADPAGADAVYTLLDQEKQAFNTGFAALPDTAQPSEFVAFLEKYITEMQQAIPEACPEPVAKKFGVYLDNCEKLRVAIKPLPDDYDGDTFMVGIRDLYSGHYDKAEFLGGTVTEAGKLTTEGMSAVFKVATDHGLYIQ